MGLLFSPGLLWDSAHRKLSAQAQKAMFSISKYQKHFGFFRPNELFKIFDSVVSPILCYGSQIWGTD
jgi:hypothetical protein